VRIGLASTVLAQLLTSNSRNGSNEQNSFIVACNMQKGYIT